MGGGASSIASVEELLTTSIMIGRAIAAITCPGMFRIYDFHSSKAPKLRNARTFSFFPMDSDEDEDEADQPSPSDYEHLFSVQVGDDVVYIEDPTSPNEAGWTPLHACCMSFMTVSAGSKLIDEHIRCGASLETRTLCGPGSFNKGWTPLQMACAYGVEPLVDRLIAAGADVNTTNCFGYGPLIEAVHRGFLNIVQALIKARANVNYFPGPECMPSPFVSAPPQSPLGEAARCGYPKIVQLLLDAGADKDLTNSIGWTPLHEACFYNRVEVVRVLLLNGANAAAVTNSGALPYQLSGLLSVKEMLKEMGGPDALPEPGNSIDMGVVLQELSMPSTTVIADADGNFEVVRQGISRNPAIESKQSAPTSQALTTTTQSYSTPPKKSNHHHNQQQHSREGAFEDADSEPTLLHSGPILGDLPSLKKSSPTKSEQSRSPSKKADGKKSKKKKHADSVPADMPQEFICQLCHRPMSDPVKTIYGNIYDRAVILNWFSTQGHFCPLTGAPLSEVDLTPMDDLREQILTWSLNKASRPAAAASTTTTAAAAASQSPQEAGDKKAEPFSDPDGLYDF